MKAKKVYELNFKTTKGWYNLIYSSKKRAQEDINTNYSIGTETAFGIVKNSYISERHLF